MIKRLPLKYDLVNLKKQFCLTSQNATLKNFYIINNAHLFKKIIQFFRNTEIFHELFITFIPQPILENTPTSYCKVENFINPHCIIVKFTIDHILQFSFFYEIT